MKISMTAVLCILVFSCASSGAAVPAIFYADLTSGPKAGGQDNKGVFVTIAGSGFGAQRGGSAVTIGGGTADNYPVWTDTRITFQLGANADSGPIVVKTADGASNGIPFTVRSGTIYFVDINATATGNGSYEYPWKTPDLFYRVMKPGDTCYFKAGVYAGKYGEQNSRSNINFGSSAPDGQPANEVAFVAYPGGGARFEATSSDLSNNINFGYAKKHYVIAGFQMNAQDSCIELRGQAIRIVNNRCEGLKEHAYAIIHTLEGSDCSLYGNELTGATSGDKLDHPVYVSYGSSGLDMGWNHIHGNNVAEGPAISVNTDNAYVNKIVFGNIRIHDNTIDCRGSSRPLRALGIVATGAGSSVYVYNNVIIEPGGEYPLYQYSASGYWYNNTIYNVKGPPVLFVGPVTDGANLYRPETVEIKNNIMTTASGPYLRIEQQDVMAKVTVTNNCYYGGGPAFAGDPRAVSADPQFVNADAGDFHLKSNSPCINAGAPAGAIAGTDKDGVQRPPSFATDIGAYEYAPGGSTFFGSTGTFSGDGGVRSIQGFVLDPTGAGVGNVTVMLSGTRSATTVTSENGAYRFDGLPEKGAYSVGISTAAQSAEPVRRSTATLTGDIFNWNFTVAPELPEGSVPENDIRIVGSSKRRGTVNPDKGEKAIIYFNGSKQGSVELRIYTLLGEEVFSAVKDNVEEGFFEWDPVGKATGIYIVAVKGAGIDTRKKVAVVR